MRILVTSVFISALAPSVFLPSAHAAGNVAAGERHFTWCASCHQVGASARNGFGPPLNGLFGRRAGTAPDYQYSNAMKTSGIVWSDRTLGAFLHDPGHVVPGTKMRFWGIGDDQDIADLLAYLHTFQGNAPASVPAR